MNPLYDMINGNQNNTGLAGFLQRLNNLKQTFHGDPNQKIMEMLNSGQITQEQYNRAAQQAMYIQKLLGK